MKKPQNKSNFVCETVIWLMGFYKRLETWRDGVVEGERIKQTRTGEADS